jgi:flagellar biosynthetic protein FliS
MGRDRHAGRAAGTSGSDAVKREERLSVAAPFGHAAQSYRKAAVETAGPAQLIVEVHDAALTSVLQHTSHVASELALVRAHSLVCELQSALRPEHDTGLATELNAFYDALLHRLVNAYVDGNTSALPQVAAALRELRSAWSQLSERGPKRTS